MGLILSLFNKYYYTNTVKPFNEELWLNPPPTPTIRVNFMYKKKEICVENFNELSSSKIKRVMTIDSCGYSLKELTNRGAWKCVLTQHVFINGIASSTNLIIPKEVANLIHLRCFDVINSDDDGIPSALTRPIQNHSAMSHVRNDDKIIIFKRDDLIIIDNTIKQRKIIKKYQVLCY